MFLSVSVEVDKKMMSNAWTAHDAEGRIISCGVLGVGHRIESTQTGADPAVSHLRVGIEAYEALKRQCDNL